MARAPCGPGYWKTFRCAASRSSKPRSCRCSSMPRCTASQGMRRSAPISGGPKLAFLKRRRADLPDRTRTPDHHSLPGEYVAVPPGVAHSFATAGDRPARWLTIHTPDGGFADFMRGVRDGIEVEWDIARYLPEAACQRPQQSSPSRPPAGPVIQGAIFEHRLATTPRGGSVSIPQPAWGGMLWLIETCSPDPTPSGRLQALEDLRPERAAHRLGRVVEIAARGEGASAFPVSRALLQLVVVE